MCTCDSQYCPECGMHPKHEQWDLEKFHYSGGYLMYGGRDTFPARRFVARFKYGKPARSAATWKKFLVENFTPYEYFGRLANRETPLDIMRSKGYELPHVAAMRARGA